VLTTQFTVGDFGGFGVDFAAAGSTGPQDWSGTDGFGFWFHGANSGLLYQAEILDNRSNPSADTAERFDYDFADNFVGWRYIRIPFAAFERATDFQPAGAPNDGLTLTEMWGWAVVLPATSVPRTFSIDDVGPIDHVVDDFETGLPTGTDGGGVPIGFFTFQGASSTAAIGIASTPPAPVLSAVGEPNNLLQLDFDVTSFAGVIHNFQDPTVTAWVPQDWSRYEGFALWLYGTGSGTTLFVDLIENRNPGSTRDDAERWTAGFPDDFVGWRQQRFLFASLVRKEIGNGAPNDGLALVEVHGWALGALATGGPRSYFVDQVTLFGAAGVRPLTVAFAAGSSGVGEGGTAVVAVTLSRPLGDADPDEVTVDYKIDPGTATPDRDSRTPNTKAVRPSSCGWSIRWAWRRVSSPRRSSTSTTTIPSIPTCSTTSRQSRCSSRRKATSSWRRSRCSPATRWPCRDRGRSKACCTWRRRSWWTSTWTSPAAAHAAATGAATATIP
jgi:hypothetical protein